MAFRNRGKPKPSLRDLSRIVPTVEERKAVREALRNAESPITTAILGASIVEQELETELRARFRRADDETWKLLTGEIGPLGTFHQKIIAAYGFGILDDVIKDGLNTIRHIRNAFAHTKRLFDFEHELVVRELKAVTLTSAKRSMLQKHLYGICRMYGGPREAYVRLCLVMGLQLLEKRNKRVSNTARARLRRRRKAFNDALRSRPLPRQLGFLGLLGGLPHVDPRKTIAGGGLLGDFGSEPSASDKKDN